MAKITFILLQKCGPKERENLELVLELVGQLPHEKIPLSFVLDSEFQDEREHVIIASAEVEYVMVPTPRPTA